MRDTQGVLDAIAYVAWHGQKIRSEAPGRVVVVQPDRADLHNYAGTTHAGALYTLAETAAGVAADGIAAPLDGFILLASAQVRYTRRAEGALEAEARLDPAIDTAALAAEFASSGRAAATVGVVIRDPAGEPVFEGSFQYAMRRRKP